MRDMVAAVLAVTAGAVAIQSASLAGARPHIRAVGAPVPAARLDAAQAWLAATLPQTRRALPGLMGVYVDARIGEVVLHVHAVGGEVPRVRAQQPALAALIGYPVRIQILDAPLGDLPG